MSSSLEIVGLPIGRRRWMEMAAAGLIVNPSGARAALRHLPPVDESNRDDALAALLADLRAIVRRRDNQALLALMREDFRVEFDAGKGPDAFQRHWHSGAPGSQVWTVLDGLLALGGTFYSPTLFALPYVYTRFPVDLDWLRYLASVKPVVAVRQGPNAKAAEIAVLEYEIVPLATVMTVPVILAPTLFVQVRHPDAGLCYVAASDVYSPAGHRAFFERRQGRWQWLSLAAAALA